VSFLYTTSRLSSTPPLVFPLHHLSSFLYTTSRLSSTPPLVFSFSPVFVGFFMFMLCVIALFILLWVLKFVFLQDLLYFLKAAEFSISCASQIALPSFPNDFTASFVWIFLCGLFTRNSVIFVAGDLK